MRQPKPPVPDHLRPLPPRPRSHGWLWQVPLGVVLTLAVLFVLAGRIDHCAQSGAFCQKAPSLARSDRAPAPPRDSPNALRPVMGLAFAPLPLSMANTPPPQDYSLPPGQTVEEAATRRQALALDQMNLIAVVDAEGTRHALVRLPNGRILRLREGDRLEDGTVAAIGERTLYMLGHDNRPRALSLGG